LEVRTVQPPQAEIAANASASGFTAIGPCITPSTALRAIDLALVSMSCLHCVWAGIMHNDTLIGCTLLLASSGIGQRALSFSTSGLTRLSCCD
jgi:hypothetical protein